MSFIQKIMKYITVIFIVSFVANVQALTVQEGNIYQQEFKALKEQRFHKCALDRQASFMPSQLMTNIENAKKVGLIGRILRANLWNQNPIVVTRKHMPALLSYVREVCQKLGMAVPTVCITKSKTGFFGGSNCQSDSTKILLSSGAILIGQDLLLDVSQKAIEAAIAKELFCVGYNHGNKGLILKWIAPFVVPSFLFPANPASPDDEGRNIILAFILARMIISKEFEKQADQFVCATMNNAEGLIELCTYWQQKERRVDTDYDAVSDCLRKANISFSDYIGNGFNYHLHRTGHRLNKVRRWILRNTFFGSKQSYENRIYNAQRSENAQKQINALLEKTYGA